MNTTAGSSRTSKAKKPVEPPRGRIKPNRTAIKNVVEHYKQAYAQYRDSVLSGERNAGIPEKQKVERQEADIKNGIPGYRWDIDEGIKPLVWIAFSLRFPLGGRRGQPMRFEPWQAYDTMVLFGWVSDPDAPDAPEIQERRFKDCFIEVARKNGKSTYIAALLCYLIFGEKQGVSGYIGATTLGQAGEAFKRAAQELKLGTEYKDEHGHWVSNVDVADSKNNKVIEWNDSSIEAIPAKPSDGKLAYAAVMDEYHQHESNELFNSIRSGNVSEQDALMMAITTAGTNINGVCHEEYLTCKKILAGEADVPSYFVAIYELDPKDDPHDASTWDKANPNMGVSVDKKKLITTYNKAKLTEANFQDFKTKNLNIWCHGSTRWANMEVWTKSCCWDYPMESLLGRPAYGGLDLSSVSDFTSFTLDFPIENDRHVQLQHSWVPEEEVVAIERRVKKPIQQWIKEGYITATPGHTIDYDVVAQYLEVMCERYKVPYIAVDKWHIDVLLPVMPDWFTDVAYEFSQGMKSMSPTIRAYEKYYLDGKLTALGNPVMTWMMDCAEAYTDTTGNIKLGKPKQRSDKRIDGVITGVMAHDCALTHHASYAAEDLEKMFSFF